MTRILLTAFLFLGFFTAAHAQLETPQPSPESTLMQKIGLTDVSVNYSRPSKKGREIFGGLVPYDQIWRTGANGSTDITFSQDVEIMNVPVKAGTYSIYTKPGKSEWTVYLYKETDHWGTPKEFDQNMVVVSAQVKPMRSNLTVETFTIDFANLSNDGADLVFAWDNTLVSLPFSVPTKAMMQKNIEQTFDGPTANDYFGAARYYYEENMQLDQALQWVQKATSMKPDAFWMLKLQSEIQAQLGDKFNAIQSAKKSMELAQKAGNMQYVTMNKANIAKWSKR